MNTRWPGNARHRRACGTCSSPPATPARRSKPKTSNVDIAADDIDALLDFAVREDIALTIVGPEGPLGRRHRRPFHRRGARVLWTDPRGGAPGRIEGVHQGFPAAASHTHGELRHLHTREFRSRLHTGAAPAAGREGRRTRGRQGRRDLRDARFGDSSRERHARRQLRRRRQQHRDRRIPAAARK